MSSSFNLFQSSGEDNNLIRVARVDEGKGIIDDMTIDDANLWSYRNPGTTFIFIDGDNNVHYLGINQVNKLKNKNLYRREECNTRLEECGPPKVKIYGGGGVGAAANPVISQSGSILAIDVVHGGYGYETTPAAEILDSCDIGSGAVLKVDLGTEPPFEEYFDEIEDIIFPEIDENITPKGSSPDFDENGNPLLDFNPQRYFKLDTDIVDELLDPIQRQIADYTNLIRSIKNPWWTTRKVQPGRITVGTETLLQVYAVNMPQRFRDNPEGPQWSSFMDQYAISPVPPSDVIGSDFAGRLFVHEWDIEFPFDGDYVFRGSSDNKGVVYVDSEKILDITGFGNEKTKKRHVKKGIHRLRLDLLNIPTKKTVTEQIETGSSEVIFKATTSADYSISASIPELGVSFSKKRGESQIKETSKKTIEFGKVYTIFVETEAGQDTKIRLLSNNSIGVEDAKDNDFNDIILSCSNGRFFDVTNKGCKFVVDPPDDIKSDKSSGIETISVFNTADYVDKAHRKLWRASPQPSGQNFIADYGVMPFPMDNAAANANDYAGVHLLIWEYINFPVDGQYEITVGVDDNVKIYIGNNIANGKKDIGNGLRDIRLGGDETIIEVKGFKAPSTPNPITKRKIFFKKGTYRIRAELEQISGKPIAKGNPMVLAIDIKTNITTKQVVSPSSWNDNPMGIALTIDAPLDQIPVPQEPVNTKKGRCPDNPIWTTRHPGSSERWYPVEIEKNKGGNPYLNRYTMSPVPPLDTPSSDGSGTVWRNDWRINIPFSGKYRVDGARRQIARILIDNKVVSGLTGVYTAEQQKWVEENFTGWEDPKTNTVNVGRKSAFVYLEEGEHTISVELVNLPQKQQTIIKKEIFGSHYWIGDTKPSTKSKVPVKFTVYGQGSGVNMGIAMSFESEDGKDNFTIENVNRSLESKDVIVNLYPDTNYKVVSYSKSYQPTSDIAQVFDFKYENSSRVSSDVGRRVRNNNKEIVFDDNKSDGFDINATFRIISTSPGITAQFNDKGNGLIVRGKGSNTQGEVTLRLNWNDNPNTAKQSVGSIEIDGIKWTQSNSSKGSEEKTLKINLRKGKSGERMVVEQGIVKESIKLKDGRLQFKEGNEGQSNIIFADVIGSVNDNDDMVLTAEKGSFTAFNLRKNVRGVSGRGEQSRNTWDLSYRLNRDSTSPPLKTTSSTRENVTYFGPELFQFKDSRWSDYFNKYSVSSVYPNIDEENENILGNTTYKWTNVDFPVTDQYEISLLADNQATLYIDGVVVASSLGFKENSPSWVKVNVTKGKHDIEVVLFNNPSAGTIFRNNPSGHTLRIRVPIIIEGDGASWKDNPMGISAALISPPCPKDGGGVGIVTQITPINPGNSYIPSAPGPVYNVGLELVDIIPDEGGFGYLPGTPIEIDPPIATAVIQEVGPNGEIAKIGITTTAIGFTDWPTLIAPNGFNANLVPVFKVVRDPIISPEKLIQVTDLVGLKQTGYVNGRAYYGAVFYKEGVRYAGYYETAGDLVQVYDTLQESIDAQITTPPSAILRQGTDITSNDPRLNIPNTPSSGINFE